MDLPDPILQHIREVVEKEYEYSDERIHVIELCGCLLKAFLQRKIPIEKDFNRLWYIYRGLIFDELWTRRFERNQIRVTHRIRGGPTIVGRIDFIHDGKIYELKTINTVRRIDEPLEHHVKQVRFYAYCENVNKAVIIYVSFDGYKCFEVDCSDEFTIPVVEEFEQKAMKLYRALKNNQPPEPEDIPSWVCKYCEYYLTYCGGREVGCFKSEVIGDAKGQEAPRQEDGRHL